MGKLLFLEIKTNLSNLYLGCVIFFICSLFMFGVSNLTHDRIIQFIELIFTLLGIILFTTIYAIDNTRNTILIINSKRYHYSFLLLLRLFLTIVFTILLILIGLVTFKICNSNVVFIQDIFIALTNTMFIGSLSLFISMISKNALIGYMFGLVYFLLCLGFKNMSFMYLFSETFGFPFYFKLIQFSISILVSIITIYITKKVKI